MIKLNPQEEQALKTLVSHESENHKLFQLNTLIHVIGSFIGWISIIIFLFATGLPPLFFAFMGLVQMLSLVAIQDKNYLSPSLLLILILLGHLAFFIGLLEGLDLSLFYALCIEALITPLALFYYHCKSYHFLQMSFLFILIFLLPSEYHFSPPASLTLWSLSLCLLLYLWIYPHKLLASSRLALMLVQSGYILSLFSDHDLLKHLESESTFHAHFLQYLSLITTLFLISFLLYSFRQLRSHTLSLLLMLTALLISWFASQALSLPLLFVALSFYSHEHYMRYFSLTLFALFLIYYYATLLMPLDQKALILMLTGAVLLLVVYLLKHQRKPS